MQTVTLNRFKHSPDGTLGELTLPNGDKLYTIEPPWQNNQPGISCIPAGTYLVKRDLTGRFQFYAVQDVPNRSAIEIHPANYFINPTNGKQELHGCIAPGLQHDPKVPCVYNSRKACKRLVKVMGDADWQLDIVGVDES